jgi:hypothetical protein
VFGEIDAVSFLVFEGIYQWEESEPRVTFLGRIFDNGFNLKDFRFSVLSCQFLFIFFLGAVLGF